MTQFKIPDAPRRTQLTAHFSLTRGGFAVTAQLDVAGGELVALIGANGAGKSTVLAALAGHLPLDDGTIRLGDRTLNAPGLVRIPPERRRVGLVWQQALCFPHLSALDNVAFGQRAQGGSRRDAAAEASDWLARVGLADQAHTKAARLSGGQQRRLALARALAADPELLLLDEPFESLDHESAVLLRELVRTWVTDTNRPAILVTHDRRDARSLADRVIRLERGHTVAASSRIAHGAGRRIPTFIAVPRLAQPRQPG
ncbi:MAG TPA: ATP-binding cassette domain-containing protein [Candidatus Lumbricidophila sp.]|nr:ATP-binding cassette domain-containing protein [Candidatus Lumbricidophila sp.]